MHDFTYALSRTSAFLRPSIWRSPESGKRGTLRYVFTTRSVLSESMVAEVSVSRLLHEPVQASCASSLSILPVDKALYISVYLCFKAPSVGPLVKFASVMNVCIFLWFF